MNLQLLAAQIAGKVAEAQSILSVDAPSTEDVTRANALLDDAKQLKAQHDAITGAQKAQSDLSGWLKTPDAPPAPALPDPPAPTASKGLASDLKGVKVPARAMRRAVGNFLDDDAGSAQQKAFAFGHWFAAVHAKGRGKAADWCREHGLAFMEDADAKAMTEGIATAGGYLVPEVFVPDLIRIVEQYGAFRNIARTERMTSDTKTIPRRTSGLTAYFVGENTAPTASDIAVDVVNLVAKKMATLTYHSSELDEDSAVDIGDILAKEIGQAFAYKEDICGFNGDGTSDYGGMVGITRKFRDSVEGAGGTWTTDADRLYNPTLFNATGNLWSEAAQADFFPVLGAIVSSADGPDCVWVCHRVFYYTVMARLALAAGGTTTTEIVNGVRRPMFLGYPVVISQVLPAASAASSLCCLFGNFKLATAFGDRRSISIATSDQFLFSTDQIAVRGTERFDCLCHEVGTAHATATSQVPGPIGGLCTLNA